MAFIALVSEQCAEMNIKHLKHRNRRFIFVGPVYDTWTGTWKEQCVLRVSNTHDSIVETYPEPRAHEYHVLSWATNTIFFLSLTEQSQANSNAFETNLPPL